MTRAHPDKARVSLVGLRVSRHAALKHDINGMSNVEDHNCPPNCCAGTVRVRRSDFEQFKACSGFEAGQTWFQLE